MKGIMQNKLMLVGIVAVVIVIGVALFMFMQNSKKAVVTEEVAQTQEEQGVPMSPEDIGLTLAPNAANTEVEMEITDVSKFKAFDYEMNYDAEVEGEVVPRGAIGSGEVKAGETSIKRSITIGTCSAGKCKYDKGVTKISFIIRLTLNDGKVGLVKKDVNLSE